MDNQFIIKKNIVITTLVLYSYFISYNDPWNSEHQNGCQIIIQNEIINFDSNIALHIDSLLRETQTKRVS